MHYKFSHLTDYANCLQLKIIYTSHCTLDPGWHFDNHCNNYNRLYFVLDGHGYLYNEKERVDLLPDNIYLIPANSSYNYRCDDFLEKIYMHFNLYILPDNDLLSNIDRIVTINSSAGEMNRLKNLCYDENISSAMFFQNFVRNISADILTPYAKEITKDLEIYKKYERLYKYIEDNLYADTKIADICRYMGFSQTYIGQQFKADTGQSIKAFLTEMLIQKLKHSFQTSNKSIKDIANELHFNNEFYCSKFFKRHVGISPREYITQHKLYV